MKKHLELSGVLNNYETSVNAFAFSAMIVWLLRYSAKHTVGETLKKLKEKRKVFAAEFGWRISPKYLRKGAQVLLPFARCGLLLPMVIAAKAVKRWRGK